MDPGDLLYVPKHWWHFVMCVDTAVSVNTWIELVSSSFVWFDHYPWLLSYCRRVIHKTD